MRFAIKGLILLSCAVGVVAQRLPAQDDVLRLDPALNKLIPRGAKVEQLTSNYQVGEGPVWSRRGGYLLATALNEIIRWTPGGGFSVFSDHVFKGPAQEGIKVGPNGLTFDLQGRLIAAEQGARRITRLERDGASTVLADRYEGKRLNSPNDVVVRRKTGDVYFTDPNNLARRNLPDPDGFFRQELEVSGVYRIAADRKLELVIRDLPFPNGIAFSLDERKLYVSNTLPAPKRSWWVYDVADDGSVRGGKLFFDGANLPGVGVPDSMKVDRAGNLYAAGPGGILIISPQGRHLGAIHVPGAATNCAWGDADGQSLFITANTGLYRIRLNVGGRIP